MHIARKRFGQNFLTDKNIVLKIIDEINPKPDQTILEIGPGLGALTVPLLKACKKLYAIELDRDVIIHLKNTVEGIGELILYQGDILKFHFSDVFNKPLKIRCVGNLPYNISTPLMFHLLKQREWLQDMYFMLQKEMVDRIVAKPGSKDYGRLSIMLQYLCQVEKIFVIKPSAFTPSPKVDSAIIHLKPHDTLPFKANDEQRFANLVRDAFNMRRKTISNSVKQYLSVNDLLTISIDPKMRPEQLSIADFVNMANFISD